MAKYTKKSRKLSRRRKTNKRKITQRGGGLKEDALDVLRANNITDLDNFLFSSGEFKLNENGTSYNNVIYGNYTFIKARDMSRTYTLVAFETSNPENKVILYTYHDY